VVHVCATQVDQKNEAVLLPIYGLLVPFHIATVKSVSSQQDGGHSYIRIIFNVPAAGYGPNDIPTQKFARSIYVKEVSFRSNDTRHSYQVVQLIKTLRRQVAQRESERAERATLVTQERLQIGKGRPIRYVRQERRAGRLCSGCSLWAGWCVLRVWTSFGGVVSVRGSEA
jgi:nucleosome binding factor SPN SPT16 subunit